MADMNKTARDFYRAVEGVTKNDRKGGYDTQATVRRIEDGVAYVHIPGGVDETPAKLTINASAGDVVQVRVANGRAFLVGNASAPPTDNTEAIKALTQADIAAQAAGIARQRADEATADAQRAHDAADAAQSSADAAQQTASAAQASADAAATAASNAQTSADNAQQSADDAQTSADNAAQAAGTAQQSASNAATAAANAQQTADAAQSSASAAATAAGNAQTSADNAASAAATAQQTAETAQTSANNAATAAGNAQQSADAAATAARNAQTSADNAQTSATTANTAANNALSGLGMVESVVDVVNWFAEHKTLSTDTTVNANKTYYSYDSSTGVLTKLDPVGTENPSALGWYELGDAISQYVASHVATTNDGLYVVSTANGWRVLVSSGGGNYPAGVLIIDPNGNVAQQTTVNGVTFNTGRPVKIGDQTAYINFDGNGHITVIGADLTIGGANNVSGVLTVKDATGATIGTWDKDGINATINGGAFHVEPSGRVVLTKINPTTSTDFIAFRTINNVNGEYKFSDLVPSGVMVRDLNRNSGGDVPISLSDTGDNPSLELNAPMYGASTTIPLGIFIRSYDVGVRDNIRHPTITLKGNTTGDNSYFGSNPKLTFQNANASQSLALVFTDQDSVQSPASLALAGNQGGEYFIAPNIKVTSGLEVGSAKFYTPSETTATRSGSYITSGSITVHRRGNVGHIYGNITIGSAVASQTTIATIPDGYRPATTDFIHATNGSFFRVNSDGTFQAQNALAAGNYYFSTTYPLA